MNEETVDDLDLRCKRRCIHCNIWYPVEYVEAQPEEGWDIDLNRPFYACKRCLDGLVGLGDYIVKDEDGIFERFSEKQFLRLMTLNDSM